MKRIRYSVTNSSVRTLSRSIRFARKTRCLYQRGMHHGLLRNQFMPASDLDLMAFYVQRTMDTSKQAPRDLLRLISQLNNVEAKVKAMEDKLGGERPRNLNVLPLKEHDDIANPRRTKYRKRKKAAICLCFPWGCGSEPNELIDRRKHMRRDMRSNLLRRESSKDRMIESLQNSRRISNSNKVSWDEGVSVRYIEDESTEDVFKKIPIIKEQPLQKYPSVEKSLHGEYPDGESPVEDDENQVVHLKIRIPKHNKELDSSNIVKTGRNIEPVISAEELYSDFGNTAVLEVKNIDDDHESAAPEKNTVGIGTDMISHTTGNTENQGETFDNGMEVLYRRSGTKRSAKKQREKQEIANVINIPEPKINAAPNIVSETKTNTISYHQLNVDSRKTSGQRKISTVTKNEERKEKNYFQRPTFSKKEEYQKAEQEIVANSDEHVGNEIRLNPITMIGRPSARISEHTVVGIPVKEAGRRTCGSQGCQCRGSTKNDNNLYELKRSIGMEGSDESLLDIMLDRSAEPDEVDVDTDFGKVHVTTHHSNCNCFICQTFGSHQIGARRNSIRSDTGAMVSKRVVRVRYDNEFRNVVTHTEECGCAICIGIEEHAHKNRSRKSTKLSTRNSILMVQNKGVCGCTDCKTITTETKPSENVEEFKNGIRNSANNSMKTMISKTSYRSIDPCYYSDATNPSIKSFPLKHLVAREDSVLSRPSVDTLGSSKEDIILPKKKHLHKEVFVTSKVKRVSKNKNRKGNNNSVIIISATPIKGLVESIDPYSNEWKRGHPKNGRGSGNKCRYLVLSPDGEYNDRKVLEYQNCESKQENIKKPPQHQKSIHKRNKAREIGTQDTGGEINSHSSKKRHGGSQKRKSSHKKSKSPDRSKMRPTEYSVDDNEKGERDDQHEELEEIIKNLVSGQADGRDSAYKVSLGNTHDKPYTKLKIIDRTKLQTGRYNSVTLSSESLHVPEHYDSSSNIQDHSSSVYYSRPLLSITDSLTQSSIFAKSEEPSVIVSPSIVMSNQCQVLTPVCHSYSQPVSQTSSLLITLPVKGVVHHENELIEVEQGIIPANNTVECSLTSDQCVISPLKSKQRTKKHGKFTIKLSGKFCSFFKRNGRKNAISSACNPITTK